MVRHVGNATRSFVTITRILSGVGRESPSQLLPPTSVLLTTPCQTTMEDGATLPFSTLTWLSPPGKKLGSTRVESFLSSSKGQHHCFNLTRDSGMYLYLISFFLDSIFLNLKRLNLNIRHVSIKSQSDPNNPFIMRTVWPHLTHAPHGYPNAPSTVKLFLLLLCLNDNDLDHGTGYPARSMEE